MFTIKAIVAVALTALGGAAAGTVIYMQTHPPVSPPDVSPEPEQTVFRPLVRIVEPVLSPDTAPPGTVAKPVAPLAKNSPAPVHRKRAPAAEAEAAPVPIPCSGWRDLESGPENRKVRMLCTPSQGK